MMRKLVGSLAILAWLVFYIGVAALVGDRIVGEHWAWKLLYFPIAGIGWILPVKPIIQWANAKDPPSESPNV